MISGLLFVLELFTAEILFTYRLKRAKYYPLRLLAIAGVLALIAAFIPYIDNVWYTTFLYFMLFSITLVGFKFTYTESWQSILFCCIAAYASQHLAFQYCNIVFTVMLGGESPLLGIYHNEGSGSPAQVALWSTVSVLCYLTVYGVLWVLFARKIKQGDSFLNHRSSLLLLITGCLLLNIILNTVVLYSGQDLNISNSIVWYLSSMFNCVLLLRWQYELLTTKRLQTELGFTNKLLAQAQEQYAMSKENIDLINTKCHDMKHQIREIGQYKQLDPETIADLEKTISVYDAAVKTDNEALDIILTEKSLKCLQNGVILNCIADGKALGFMKNSDVYSLFGNALDNAIEAVLKIEEQSQRVIGLKVYQLNDFVTVSIRNFYSGVIPMKKNGLPDTTKDDRDIHGYGMESIKLIVDSYGGDLSVTAQDGVFVLNILFHREERKA